MVAPPCGKCNRHVAINHKAIQCDVCDKWIHIKCNGLKDVDYVHYQDPVNEHEQFICINCMSENVPFSNLNNNEFFVTVKRGCH